jgi:hypothetical protein
VPDHRQLGVGVDHRHLGVCVQHGHERVQVSRQPLVVVVAPGDIGSVGGFQTGRPRPGRADAAGAQQPNPGRRDAGRRTRPVVDEDDLVVRPDLAEHRVQGPGKQLRPVAGADDRRDARP